MLSAHNSFIFHGTGCTGLNELYKCELLLSRQKTDMKTFQYALLRLCVQKQRYQKYLLLVDFGCVTLFILIFLNTNKTN